MLGKNALKMGKSPQRMIVHAILWSTYNHLCLEGRGSLGYIYIYIRFISCHPKGTVHQLRQTPGLLTFLQCVAGLVISTLLDSMTCDDKT